MVETMFDIRFSADDEIRVGVESNASGEVAQQAELVCLAHFAARIILLLGPERAAPLADSLTTLEEATGDDLVALSEQHRPVISADRALQVHARFLNMRGGPRIFFRLKRSGMPPLSRGDPEHAVASVHALLYSLLRRQANDPRHTRRLAKTAGLIGRSAASGQIRPGNEFDVSLAAADLAWRVGFEDELRGVLPWDGNVDALQCPSCGNGVSFGCRLWPSDSSAIRECGRCRAGLWLRARRRPRLLKRDVWEAMEALRAELRGGAEAAAFAEVVSTDGEENVLLERLKQVFAENRWPFSEVQGAEVLLSELSGALGHWKFYAQVVEEQGLILLYSISPLRAPENRRAEVAQFLTGANYGLAAGNFELDFEDGEIRYKTVLQLQSDQLDSITLKRLVRANGIAMETYLPGIGAVIAGTPALRALERRTTS
jgi:hypothetical protein